MIDRNKADRLNYEEDLCKLRAILIPVMQRRLLKVSQVLGFGESKDSKSLFTDPDVFLKDINYLVGDKPKDKLLKAKEGLANFNNISNKFKRLCEKGPDNKELDYLISVSYFFKGIIYEAENNFISAHSNYEKAVNSPSIILSHINERKNRILPKVDNEYFNRPPSIKRVGNINVFWESESPLIITGVVPGVDNYLEYEAYPVKIIIQKYSSTKLKIQGEVLGGTSCIMPRVVFRGTKGIIGETALKHPVKGNFDINFSFLTPDGASTVEPRITFDSSCFSEGQKIIVKDFKWH